MIDYIRTDSMYSIMESESGCLIIYVTETESESVYLCGFQGSNFLTKCCNVSVNGVFKVCA